jgi:DNA-binding NtrC family response regulator
VCSSDLGFSDAAVAALSAYPWPGNVRELTELVKTVSSRKKQGTVVGTADLPPEILYGHSWKEGGDETAAGPHPDIRRAIEDLEKPMLLQALAVSEGDRRKAAELLHIDLDGLLLLIRKHAIEE